MAYFDLITYDCALLCPPLGARNRGEVKLHGREAIP